MSSKLRLQNANGKYLTIEHSDIGSKDINLIAEKIIQYVDTIEELEQLDNANTGDVVLVKDKDRGGIFVYDENQSSVNDGGIVFNGWIRQYNGPINVKWFDINNLDYNYLFNNFYEIDFNNLTINILDTINIELNNNIKIKNGNFIFNAPEVINNSSDIIDGFKIVINNKKVIFENINIKTDNSDNRLDRDQHTGDRGLGAFHISGTGHITFNNCKVTDFDGVAFSFDAVYGKIIVNNCYVNNVYEHGIYLSDCEYAICQNNLIENTYERGIQLRYSNSDRKNNYIIKNNKIHNPQYGILIFTDDGDLNIGDELFYDNITIKENYIKNPRVAGITNEQIAQDIKYSNNTIIEDNATTGSIGIKSIGNNIVSDNKVKGLETGLRIAHNISGDIEKNIIENSTLRDIFIYDCERTWIKDNVFNSPNIDYAIVNGTLVRVRIKDNKFYYPDKAVSYYGSGGWSWWNNKDEYFDEPQNIIVHLDGSQTSVDVSFELFSLATCLQVDLIIRGIKQGTYKWGLKDRTTITVDFDSAPDENDYLFTIIPIVNNFKII